MIDQSIAMFAALGRPSDELEARMDKAAILRLAGDDASAERELRRVRAESEQMGNAGIGAWACCRLAEVLVARGRAEEAEEMVQESERVGTPLLQARHIAVRARIRASAGDGGAAVDVERLVALLDDGHTLQKTDLLIEAAEIMLSVGQPVTARHYASQASELATAKESVVLGRRIDALLGRITEATPRSD